MDDLSCLFCCEKKTVSHLFFECCMARLLWSVVSDVLGFSVGDSFESVAKLWVMSAKYKLVNVFTSPVFWSPWKTRNDMCFQVPQWMGMRKVLGLCGTILRNWCILIPKDTGNLVKWAKEMEHRSVQPPRIAWQPMQGLSRVMVACVIC
jgi:hypothetical protein